MTGTLSVLPVILNVTSCLLPTLNLTVLNAERDAHIVVGFTGVSPRFLFRLILVTGTSRLMSVRVMKHPSNIRLL